MAVINSHGVHGAPACRNSLPTHATPALGYITSATTVAVAGSQVLTPTLPLESTFPPGDGWLLKN